MSRVRMSVAEPITRASLVAALNAEGAVVVEEADPAPVEVWVRDEADFEEDEPARIPVIVLLAGPTDHARQEALLSRGATELLEASASATLMARRVLRCVALAADPPRPAQPQADDRVAEMETFLFTALHDMKSPLLTIRRYARLLVEEQTAVDEDGRHFLERIEINARRLSALIQNLVQVVRVDRMAFTQRQCALDDVLREALRQADPELSGVDVTIKASGLSISGDFERLVDVFLNLLTNAGKYRSSIAKPEIEIIASREGQRLVVAVRDNGIGIPESHLERVFEVFERLHTRDQIEGSGLGLAIVRRIVARHGGEVSVQSSLGQGSTFRVCLPINAP